MAKKAPKGTVAPRGRGRPRVHREGKAVTFWLSVDAIERLDELAKAHAKATGKPANRSAVLVELLMRSRATGQSVRDGLA